MELKKHAKQFLKQYTHKSSARVNYGYTLNEFFNYIKSRQIKHITMLRIEQFLLSPTHANKRPSNHYYNFRLSALRSFYNYLLRHELIDKNPTQFIKSQKTQSTHSERVLSAQEVRYILRHTTNPARLAILVMVNTGLRISELAAVRQSNLKQLTNNTDTITYLNIKGKGGKTRNLNVHPHILKAIKQEFRKNKHLANTPLFPGLIPGSTITPRTLYKKIKKQLKPIGFPNASPHWFRHTFAQLISQNTDLQTTQQALGHTNLNTTQRYIQKLKIINISQSIIKLD